KILSNEDNISSLVMTAQSRGDVDRFQGWIQMQGVHVEDPLTKARPDINGRASANFRELIAMLRAGNTHDDSVRHRLRSGYATNMAAFCRQNHIKAEEAQARQSVIQTSSIRVRSTISSAQSLSPTPYYGSSRFSSQANPVSNPQSMAFSTVSAPIPPHVPWM